VFHTVVTVTSGSFPKHTYLVGLCTGDSVFSVGQELHY
jgi:hypothetical protein